MAPAIITHTDIGFPANNGASKAGTGVVWGIYEVTSTEDDDWTVLQDFSEILFVDCVKFDATNGTVTSGEAVRVSGTTTNQLVFTAGSTNVIRVLVAGTRGE